MGVLKVKVGTDWVNVGGGPVSAGLNAVVDVYPTPGAFTWNKPVGAVLVDLFMCGGGGGGGSGRRGAAGSVRCGGGGGSSGAYSESTYDATQLPATVTVTVGAGGAGGTSIGANDTNGNSGSNGVASKFQVTAGAEIFLYASPGIGGAGGTNATGLGGVVSTGLFAGTIGAAANTTGNAGSSGGAAIAGTRSTGGGSGGGLTTANLTSNGGNGGFLAVRNIQILGGFDSGPVGGNSQPAYPAIYFEYPGSGGGASSNTANAGSGGGAPTGNHGSGGGGGGASLNGIGNSGAGGKGGDGCVIVVTYCVP